MQPEAGEVTANDFWENRVNWSDTTTVTTAIFFFFFCSLQTINRNLCKCRLITPSARITMPSVGIAVINLSIGAPPSFSIAVGPYAPHALHCGTAAE